jgi:integrase/recombinase XerD
MYIRIVKGYGNRYMQVVESYRQNSRTKQHVLWSLGLYGIADDKKKALSNILKLKVPEEKPKTLSKNEIKKQVNACSNYRDQFLLNLLYETGLRIGEVLSLWIEDFSINDKVLDLKDRGEFENKAEIKTVASPRRINVSQNLTDMFMEYLVEYHTVEVETNHIFIKLSGDHQYKPMDYVDVDNLFRRIEKKTGIHATPHMFRHSSLTLLRKAGWKPEQLRIRAGHINIYTTLRLFAI